MRLKNSNLVGWVVAPLLVGILLLLFEYKVFAPKQDSRKNSPSVNAIENDKPESTLQNNSHNERTYNVILVLPSRMSDGTILVDGEPAIVVNRTLTVVTIRIVAKTNAHRITVQKDGQSCSKSLLIEQNNLRFQACD